MLSNPTLAKLVAEERMKDTLREVEQARLIREAKSAGKVRESLLPTVLNPSTVLR